MTQNFVCKKDPKEYVLFYSLFLRSIEIIVAAVVKLILPRLFSERSSGNCYMKEEKKAR